MKRLGQGLVVALALAGLYATYNGVLHLYEDHQNTHRMVLWVYQKQAQEAQAAARAQQRQQQQAQQPPAEAPK